jgi:hypothetical protein
VTLRISPNLGNTTNDRKSIGLFGMYERVDAETGGRLFAQKMKDR